MLPAWIFSYQGLLLKRVQTIFIIVTLLFLIFYAPPQKIFVSVSVPVVHHFLKLWEKRAYRNWRATSVHVCAELAISKDDTPCLTTDLGQPGYYLLRLVGQFTILVFPRFLNVVHMFFRHGLHSEELWTRCYMNTISDQPFVWISRPKTYQTWYISRNAVTSETKSSGTMPEVNFLPWCHVSPSRLNLLQLGEFRKKY